MIKLVVLYLLGLVLFSLLDITTLPNLINSIISWIINSPIYTGLQNLFKTIGGFFDSVILNSETVVYTSYGYELGSLVWLGMIARIIVVIFLIRLLIKVVL